MTIRRTDPRALPATTPQAAGARANVAKAAARDGLERATLERVRTIIDVPTPPESRVTLRSVLGSIGKSLLGTGTPPDLASRARTILDAASTFGGPVPEHLPALTALRVLDAAKTSGSISLRSALASQEGIAAVRSLRHEAIDELRSLVARRPDLVFASQTKGRFPTFLGLARYETTPAFRALADVAFPINRVAHEAVEVVYRGANLPQVASSDVANINIYYTDPTTGLDTIVAGSQARPNIAASPLSMLDVLADSIGESIDDANQKIGRLLTENLIPELGIEFVGSGPTRRQLDAIGEGIDRLVRRSGGVVAITPDSVSRAFVGNIQLDELLGIINGELDDGHAELPGGAIAASKSHELMERGREILAMPLKQHLDTCYDLRSLVPDFQRAWSTKQRLGAETFAAEQIVRLPRSLAELAAEYYGRGGATVSVDAPQVFKLEGGVKTIAKHVIHVEGVPEPMTIPANIANHGDWQFDLPVTTHGGKVYIGLAPTMFNGELARRLDVLEENIAFVDDRPAVHMAAPFVKIGSDAYVFSPPKRPFTKDDIVRFRGRPGADASYDPAQYGVLTFREAQNPAVTAAMQRASYKPSGSMQLGTRASSAGEDAGLVSMRATFFESMSGELEPVDGLELRELGEVLADMRAHPETYDQATQVLAMIVATRLPSPDRKTSYWNYALDQHA